MRRTITKRAVDAMQPGEIIADDEVRGFVVRCLPSGVRSYGLRYRDRATGKRRWDAIGIHGNVTPDEARNLAKKRSGIVADERDPLAERRAKRMAAKRADSTTFNAIAHRFVERHAKKQNRRWAETDRILNRYILPAWGGRQIDGINRRDVTELLDLIQDGKLKDSENPDQKLGGPVMADRTLAVIRKLFNWHAVRDEAFRSPIVKGMARTKPKERARDRILTDDEIRALWSSADTETVYGPALKFMLLSAQRPGEVLTLRRQDIDPDGMWVLDAGSYKTKRTHYVPLSDAARAVIEAVPQHAAGDFVFTTLGSRPFSGDTRSKRRIDAEMTRALQASAIKTGATEAEAKKVKLAPWVAHDLRRTARSLMSRAGIRPDIAERVLGHVIPGVGGVYDRHTYADEKHEALKALAMLVERILTGNVATVRHLHRQAS